MHEKKGVTKEARKTRCLRKQEARPERRGENKGWETLLPEGHGKTLDRGRKAARDGSHESIKGYLQIRAARKPKSDNVGRADP